MAALDRRAWLIVYPYFTPGVPLLLGIGALICGGLWVAVRQGW